MQANNIFESFRFAFAGLWYALRTQRNARLHIVIASVAIALGLWVRFTAIEWAILALTIGSVLVSELINTVAETLVDMISPNYHPLAKVVKDVTAGAVLLAAIVSTVVGLMLLAPPVWEQLSELVLCR